MIVKNYWLLRSRLQYPLLPRYCKSNAKKKNPAYGGVLMIVSVRLAASNFHRQLQGKEKAKKESGGVINYYLHTHKQYHA